MKRTLTWSFALAALAGLTAPAAHAEEQQLSVQKSDQFGEYIADAQGRALYMYTADEQGQAGTPATSNCYGTCADMWPPLIAEQGAMERTAEPDQGMPETESLFRDQSGKTADKIQTSLISTTERRDGTMQVTYGGWPLYYYEQDTQSGETNGQGVEDSQGEWYLVAPDGSKIEQHAGETADEPSLN